MSKPTSEAANTAGPKTFRHSICVRWADCDPAKIVFTGHIPTFALEAIDAWWRDTIHHDWYVLNVDRNIGTPFVHMTLDFRSPITPRYTLECDVALIRLGNSSVRHRVTGSQNGKKCFEGEFVAVFVDADTMTKRSPPDDLFKLMQPTLNEGL